MPRAAPRPLRVETYRKLATCATRRFPEQGRSDEESPGLVKRAQDSSLPLVAQHDTSAMCGCSKKACSISSQTSISSGHLKARLTWLRGKEVMFGHSW